MHEEEKEKAANRQERLKRLQPPTLDSKTDGDGSESD